MWDGKGYGKNHEDDYTRIKKTIQEIVGMSKSKAPEKTAKIGKKKKEPEDRSQILMKQFLELKEFQKTLAAATLGGNNKKNSKKKNEFKDYRDLSTGESESKGSMSSSSSNRSENNKKITKEPVKREDYNTDELSDTTFTEDSEQAKEYATEGTVSDESDSEVNSSKYIDESIVSSATKNETSCGQPIKKKSGLSPSELAIIKDLCRDLIKKEEKPTVETTEKPVVPEKETIEVFPQEEEKASPKTEEESMKIEPEIRENQEHKIIAENEEKINYFTKPESIKNQKHGIEPEIRENQEYEIKTENEEKINYFTKPESTENQQQGIEPKSIPVSNLLSDLFINFESIPTETSLKPETEQNKTEIKECEDKLSEEDSDTVLVKGELTLITEPKEDTIKRDETIEKVHLEIVEETVTKEIVDDVEEWNHRIEEKVVIEKTVKAYVESAETAENETKEANNEIKEVALCNMSDDEIIMKTIKEMDQIDREFKVEKAPPEDETERYYLTAAGDGEQKRNLQERIDTLQEQIFSLRKQLEEVKQQNEEEAKEIDYLSSFLCDSNSSLLRRGLDWDEWELKEMVRERLQQKRQAAAQDYEARLRVVEALCSAEMGKLEEALQTLLPLNATVSAWDTSVQPPDIRSSYETQDYVFEVITSMNLSSSDENGVSGTISTNGELPSLTEWKAEGQ